MTTIKRAVAGTLLLFLTGLAECDAVEMRVSRDALERTLKQQLLGGQRRAVLPEGDTSIGLLYLC